HEHPALAFAYTIAGYALDRVGESNAARNLYQRALKVEKLPFAEESLRRLQGKSPNEGNESITVLVLSGQGPVRVPKAIPIGVLMGWLTTDFPLSSNEFKIYNGLSAEQAVSVIRFPVMQTASPAYEQ